jgi:thymidylate kinase
MSKIIVIEGPDRVGKQTQTRMLKETFQNYGMLATVVEVPIRSAITYRIIYWMLRNGLAKRFPKIFQWFQYLNRKVFQEYTLPHLEDRYDAIIMDRWSLSTIVYGAAEGVPKEYTLKLAKKLREPDFTIILHGDSFAHKAEDTYEADLELQRKVREEYADWARDNPETTKLIDCRQHRKSVSKKIKEVLQKKRLLPRY